MRDEGRFFDDMARLAGGAWSTADAMREEFEARVRERMEAALERMGAVRREEFDAVRAMAVAAREENEALAARVAALEAALAARGGADRPPAAPRS